MSYTDLKITDTDNNKEVANKINTTLDQLNVEIPKKLEADSYIKADDIKAYYIIDYNTKQVTPEFKDHTTTGVFKLCDPVALQEALKNPNTEENSAFLTGVAYIMYGLVFNNPDVLYDKDFEVIDNTPDINNFLRYYTGTLLSKEPLVYKNIVKVDDTTNRVIATVSLNGMVRYNIERCVNVETGNDIGQDTHTIYPINPTIRNTVYDIITSFINKYVEGEPLTRLTTAFNNIFKIPNIRDIETTNSLIQPAFNAEGMLVYGLYLLDNVYTDVVEFYAENMEYTKADLHKIIETGTNITPYMGDTGAGTSTIHINGRGVDRNTGLQLIGRLNNYTLLVNIKCSDGNLCYFSLVKGNFRIIFTERLDNYAPYMFGLDFFLIPTVNQPQYIKNSMKYSGYINLLSNPTIVIYAPKSNSEYLSNTVIMGMDPDSVDNRMVFGVNNTHYPAIDLSNKETNTAGSTLNILASYMDSTTDANTASATAPVYPELGYITNTKLKQEVLGTFLDGNDIYSTDIREYAITEDSPISSILELPYGKNILWKKLSDVPPELYNYTFPIIYKTKRYMHSAPEVGYIDFYYAKSTSIYGLYEVGNYSYVGVYHPTEYPEFKWHSLKGGNYTYLYDLTHGFTASDDTTYEASTNFLAITPEGYIAKLPKEQLAGLTTVDLATQVTGQLGETNIANNAITVDKLADSIITTDKIVNSAVTTVKIADSAVTATKIADNAVTATKIADSSVSTAKIADGAVTSAKIAAKTITASNIADNTITATQIAANAVTDAKFSGTLSVAKGGTGNATGLNYKNYCGLYGNICSMLGIENTPRTIQEFWNKVPSILDITFLATGNNITDLPTKNYYYINITKQDGNLSWITIKSWRSNTTYLAYVADGIVSTWVLVRKADGSIPADLISPTVLKYTNDQGTWTETKLSDGTTMLEGWGSISNYKTYVVITLPKIIKQGTGSVTVNAPFFCPNNNTITTTFSIEKINEIVTSIDHTLWKFRGILL